MNKADLEDYIVAGLSTHRIAKTTGCSQTTIRYWLRKHQLVTQPHIAPCCGQCGETDPTKFYGNKKYICGRCHNRYTIDKGRTVRQRALEYLGGKCCNCGFDKYPVSLDIHHKNPALKDPNFISMRSWRWARIEAELQDCILLCKNCHAALHAGLIIIKS